MPLAALEPLPAQAQSTWNTPRAAQSQTPARTQTASRFDASFSDTATESSVVARRPSSSQTAAKPQSNLQWRSSDRVAPRPFRSGSSTNLTQSNGPVMRVAYQQQAGEQAAPAAQVPGGFGDPFDNDLFNDSSTPGTPPVSPEPANDGFRIPGFDAPPESAPEAAPLPDALPPAVKPQEDMEQPTPLLPPTNDQRENLDDSRLDMLDTNPFKNNAPETSDSPSDRDTPPEATEPKIEPRRGFAITPPQQRSNLSCEDLRTEVASRTIGRISLDISPAYRPDVLDDEKFTELRTAFDKNQKPRDWRSVDGSLLGRGSLHDLSYQDVIIRNESGNTQTLDISRLSEPDLAFLSSEWGLPRECRIAQTAYQPRNWTPAKMTWKASNLCHNPLYFEEVQLERYGHSAGPFKQPLISTAHFFVNIAVLPYKMGIHPATECQYALGYYRPGNCAPYLLPPIPLSLRGTLSQAAVVAGGFWLIP